MPSKQMAAVMLLLFAGLIGAACWAAHWQTVQMTAWIANGGVPMPGNHLKGTSPPSFGYYLTINTVFVAILLLIPAMGLFVLRRPGGPGAAWLMFWTLALLAFLIHLWAGIADVLPGFARVFHDSRTPPRVTHPFADTVTSVWWIVDVVLAWRVVTIRPRWEQIERGLLHAVLFGSALLSSIVLSSNGYVRGAGLALLFTTLGCTIWRVVVYPFDPTSAASRLYVLFFQALNRVMPWYALPTWPAVINLGALRVVLRRDNLHDTSAIPVTNPAGRSALPTRAPDDLVRRNMDGYFNDLSKPEMGSSSAPNMTDSQSMHFTVSNPGARFGRNVPLSQAFPEAVSGLLTPSPRRISNELLARKTLIEATSLNFLAAAWIQFQTHDWFNHGDPILKDPFTIPLGPEDEWDRVPMEVRRTRPDPTRDYDAERRENGGTLKYPPTYVNAESHWWDASQIYGSNPQTTRKLRAAWRREGGTRVDTGEVLPDGKLFLDEGALVLDPSSIDPNEDGLTGFSGNWWAGLSLLHTLFAREHNAICDHLRPLYPAWDSDQLFHTARMINSALMAKIHTVEWTPAILSTPVLEIGMSANWWGLLTERLHRSLGRLSENEAFAGIPLSGVDHSGADYCLTEEFVSVYRLHPLMRDDVTICSAKTGATLQTVPMMEGLVGNLDDLTVFQSKDWAFSDVLYSFGIAHPGAITVHNYPAFLRHLKRPDEEVVDLATIDVLRDRERGVPRYNRFLELFHKKPITSFDDLENALHPGLPAELRAIYGQTDGRDNVDRLDLMVGLFSETVPPGFGFSDTAFRVFILMASRRLKSDRFVAKDFIPEIYTAEGIAWVNDTSFVSVVLRHFPELQPALYGISNGFKPWNTVGARP